MDAMPQKSQCYDQAKLLTLILVVAAHTTRMFEGNGAFLPGVLSRTLGYLTEYIYGFHMPLFILLSGCVYSYCLERGKYRDGVALVKNKARRLLVPYFAFGLCYVAPVMRLCGLASRYLTYCLKGIVLSEDSRHLWYLLTLFWIFLLAHLMKSLMVRHPWVAAGISVGLWLISLFYVVPVQLTSACHYQLFFFAGMYVDRYFARLVRGLIKWKWLTLLLPVGMLSILVSQQELVKVFCSAAGTLAMFSLVVNGRQGLDRFCRTRLYRWIKKNSFGIYLFHPMLIYVSFFLLGTRPVNPWLFSLAVIVGVFFTSGLLSDLLRRMKLGVLMGE